MSELALRLAIPSAAATFSRTVPNVPLSPVSSDCVASAGSAAVPVALGTGCVALLLESSAAVGESAAVA